VCSTSRSLRELSDGGNGPFEEKAALIAEMEAEGGKVKLVARRHRVSDSLLYNWRSALEGGGCRRGRCVGIGGVRASGRNWRNGEPGAADAATTGPAAVTTAW
jgi:transposase-like protein